jgi:hypothetical protein
MSACIRPQLEILNFYLQNLWAALNIRAPLTDDLITLSSYHVINGSRECTSNSTPVARGLLNGMQLCFAERAGQPMCITAAGLWCRSSSREGPTSPVKAARSVICTLHHEIKVHCTAYSICSAGGRDGRCHVTVQAHTAHHHAPSHQSRRHPTTGTRQTLTKR